MSPRALTYLWYGDDFTGASDTLATFARAGLKALLCLGVPDAARLARMGSLDALGIAGTARALSPETMAAELEPVGRLAVAMGVPLLHYKCCSTFDSAPGTGSIGAAMRCLQPHVADRLVAIIGGQPSLGRYCAFGTLFAAAGTGGEVFRLDRHPTMAHHPVTPMQEADLRRHLAAQGVGDIGLVDWRRLASADTAGLPVPDAEGAFLFDALEQAHLDRIGGWLWQRASARSMLAVGASSVAEAVIAHWRRIGLAPSSATGASVPPAEGPVFILAGSQSPVTARQVSHALAGGADAPFAGVPLDVAGLMAEAETLEAAAATCISHLAAGRSVLAYTGPVRDAGGPKLDVAKACARLVARVVDGAPMVRRLGIAGGDTSSLAVGALGVWALGYAGQLAPGVTLARTHADDPRREGLEVMLKGGQMGPDDLFTLLRAGTA